DQVLRRALQHDRKKRFANAQEMIAALDAVRFDRRADAEAARARVETGPDDVTRVMEWAPGSDALDTRIASRSTAPRGRGRRVGFALLGVAALAALVVLVPFALRSFGGGGDDVARVALK